MNSPTNQFAGSEFGNNPPLSNEVVPMWLIIVLFLLLYWGAVYFDEHGGWFEKQVYTPYRSSEEVASFNAVFTPDIKLQGEQVYRGTCSACHQANAQGVAGTIPSLVGSDWVNEKEPGRIVRIVLQGFTGPGLVVNGKPFNTGNTMMTMNYLSDEDIAAVISYVRGNAEWNNHASPVTPEQVHAIREKVQKSHPQFYYSPAEIYEINPAD